MEMKNQLRFPLIILFAFAAGVLAFAFYQKFFVTDKITFLETPVTVQMNKPDQEDKLDNFVLPETKTAKNSMPAFEELALHEAKIKSELNQLLLEFMPEAQEVLIKRFELHLTRLEMAKISAMPESKKPLLTFVFGKLLVRKVEAETELQNTIANYEIDSFQTRRQALKLQDIEKEISEYAPADSEESKKF